MSAILDAIKNGALDSSVSVVFSNNPDAKGLELAREHGVATESLSHKGLSRETHEEKVLDILANYEIDFVVLAGYMRVLSPRFLRAFKGVESGRDKLEQMSGSCADTKVSLRSGESSSAGQRRAAGPPCARTETVFHPEELYRIINIHPSLLPSFPGAHAYEDAWEAGVPESGITVHLVDELVDHGPILQQESFKRMPGDTLDSFKARGLAVEHKLYPSVLQSISSKGIVPALEAFAQNKFEEAHTEVPVK